MEENVTRCVDFGILVGRSQALGVIANQSAALQAQTLRDIWESGDYKLLGYTWDEFCKVCVGLSRQRVEGIIHNLEEFGVTFSQLNEIIAVSPAMYRKLQPKIQDDTIDINGQAVPILPENAVLIREAVNRLRAELRSAQDDARKANDDLDLLTSPEIAALQTRLDAWLAEIRRVARGHEGAALHGLVAYAINHLQEIASDLAA